MALGPSFPAFRAFEFSVFCVACCVCCCVVGAVELMGAVRPERPGVQKKKVPWRTTTKTKSVSTGMWRREEGRVGGWCRGGRGRGGVKFRTLSGGWRERGSTLNGRGGGATLPAPQFLGRPFLRPPSARELKKVHAPALEDFPP